MKTTTTATTVTSIAKLVLPLVALISFVGLLVARPTVAPRPPIAPPVKPSSRPLVAPELCPTCSDPTCDCGCNEGKPCDCDKVNDKRIKKYRVVRVPFVDRAGVDRSYFIVASRDEKPSYFSKSYKTREEAQRIADMYNDPKDGDTDGEWTYSEELRDWWKWDKPDPSPSTFPSPPAPTGPKIDSREEPINDLRRTRFRSYTPRYYPAPSYSPRYAPSPSYGPSFSGYPSFGGSRGFSPSFSSGGFGGGFGGSRGSSPSFGGGGGGSCGPGG